MSDKKSTRKNIPQKSKKSIINPAVLWAGAVILVFVVAAVFLLNQGSPAGADSLPREISVSEAAQLRDSGAFVLDVREPEEWAESHIPGATLIPLGELASRVDEVPQDQEVVVVCRSGNRSQQGRDILLAAGFEQVTSMAGGLREWTAAGLETVSGP